MLQVPGLHEPLLSVSGLVDEGLTLEFNERGCDIKLRDTDEVVGHGVRRDGLFYLEGESHIPSASVAKTLPRHSLLDWHRRMGHVGLPALKWWLKRMQIRAKGDELDVVKCSICCKGKMHRRSFRSRSAYRSDAPFKVIHSDVAFLPVTSREGYRYFISFIDDYSKFGYAYPMKSKNEAFTHFKHFKTRVEKLCDTTVTELRSDNGGEYLDQSFQNFLKHEGIVSTMGPPRTPQLNGVAERWNRTMGERIRCILIESVLPDLMWADALRFGVDIYNNTPSKGVNGFQAPVHILKLPALKPNQLHPFGCNAYFLNNAPGLNKLSPRSTSGLMMGHLSGNDGWYVWDLIKRKMVKSRDVMFLDDKFPGMKTSKPTPSTHAHVMPWPDLSRRNCEQPEALERQPVTPAEENHPVRPQRRRARPERYGEYVSLAREDKYTDEPDPKTFKQAKKSQNWPLWFKEASKEMETPVGRGTWKLVPRPARRHIIRCKWVCKTKRHVDRSIERLKARLVAMGFSQIQGIDYNEVFSPTSRQE